NDANVVARRGPPDRIDVAAAEPEERADALPTQRARDELAAVDPGGWLGGGAGAHRDSGRSRSSSITARPAAPPRSLGRWSLVAASCRTSSRARSYSRATTSTTLPPNLGSSTV